jgi:probable addiction module antidote protein
MKKKQTKPENSETILGHLQSPEAMAIYLESCLQNPEINGNMIAQAVGEIAKTTGMALIAERSGLCREGLYKALSGERNPTIETILKVIRAVGLRLRVEPVIAPPRKRRRKNIRTINIAGLDLRFLSISRKIFKPKIEKTLKILNEKSLDGSFGNKLARAHPWFDLPRMYAAMLANFGESAADYSADSCSFEYCFLIRIRIKTRFRKFLLRFNDSCPNFGITYAEMGCANPKNTSENELLRRCLIQFVDWLLAFAVGYFSINEKSWKIEFRRSNKNRRIIYGFARGKFFTETYNDEKSFSIAYAKAMASNITFNRTELD